MSFVNFTKYLILSELTDVFILLSSVCTKAVKSVSVIAWIILYNRKILYLFAYKRKEWKALKGFCFVKPIKDKNKYTLDKEVKLKGIVAFDSDNFKKGDVVGFEPGSEYEFIVDNNKMYRVMKNFITIKYGHKRNEETYNPSWA